MKNLELLSLKIILLSVLVFSSLESSAVPPDPGVYRIGATKKQDVMSAQIFAMTESLSDRPKGSVVGNQEIVVILIEFQDALHRQEHNDTYFNNLLFSNSNPRSMYNYYREVSYGQISVSGVVTGWYRSDYNMKHYGADGSRLDMLNGPIYELAREAIKLADSAGVNFSQYDRDNNGYIDHIIIVHSGYGQEIGGGSQGLDAIWSHHWSIWPPEQVDGVRAADYSMVAEFSPMGTAAHEFGHDLGLPDLYDLDGSSEGIGSWGLMGYGCWQMGGDIPAHLCAWSKVFLEWVSPKEVTSDEFNLILNCVEQSNSDTIIKIPLTQTEYFLLENRHREGFDQKLPGSGLLIWHIDDSKISLNNVNRDEAHKMVDLEEADGRDDLDKNSNLGDNTDPYYKGNAAEFTANTTPNSRLYSGAKSSVSVMGVSDPGVTMTLNILFMPNSAPVAVAGGSYIGGVNTEMTFNGTGSYDPDGDPLEYMWDFDASDGIRVNSSEQNPKYTYNEVGIYTVTLTVNDGEFDSQASTTTADIKVVREMSLNMTAGWNLISLYLQPLDARPESVLSTVNGKYQSIWTYDKTTEGWRKYIPNGQTPSNDLDRIKPGTGYWIMMIQPERLIIKGIQPATSIQLRAGWNLIGYSSQTPISIEDYVHSNAGLSNSIGTYDAQDGKWIWYDENVPDFLNRLKSLEPGRAYWIDAKDDYVWYIGN